MEVEKSAAWTMQARRGACERSIADRDAPSDWRRRLRADVADDVLQIFKTKGIPCSFKIC
jgi:hypothetical protein